MASPCVTEAGQPKGGGAGPVQRETVLNPRPVVRSESRSARLGHPLRQSTPCVMSAIARSRFLNRKSLRHDLGRAPMRPEI